MTQQQTQCQNFQGQLKGLPQTADIDKLMADYARDPIANQQQVDRFFADIRDKKNTFGNEYQEQAREMLRDWFQSLLWTGDKNIRQAFLESIKFDDGLRVIIDADLDVSDSFGMKYFPSLIKDVTKNLRLGLDVTRLDYLESVGGVLYCEHLRNLTSIDRLHKVGGTLAIKNTAITSLDNLESVGTLDLSNMADFASAKKLKYVGGNLNIVGTSIKAIDMLEEVGGDFNATSTKLESVNNLQRVIGDLLITGTLISVLDSLEIVGGDLIANMGLLKSMHRLRKVGKSLTAIGAKLKELDNLEEVGGSMIIFQAPVESMKKLAKVGGDFDIRGTRLKKLDSISEIGGSIDIGGIEIPDINEFFPKLTSLGKNEGGTSVIISRRQQELLNQLEQLRRKIGFLGNIILFN